MTGKFKDFYKFVKCFNPAICGIWEDFHSRKDPKEGDEYYYFDNITDLGKLSFIKIIFDKIEFDPEFKNGTAFIYKFHKEDGEELDIYSINNVDDPNKLTLDDINNLYGFWVKTFTID